MLGSGHMTARDSDFPNVFSFFRCTMSDFFGPTAIVPLIENYQATAFLWQLVDILPQHPAMANIQQHWYIKWAHFMGINGQEM